MAQYVGYYKQHNNTNNTSDTDSSYCPDTKYKDREPTKKEFGIENINENNYKKIKEKGDKISSIQMDLAFILIGWIGIGISIILVLLIKGNWYPALIWIFGIVALKYLSSREYNGKEFYKKIREYEKAKFEYDWWQNRKKVEFWFSLNGRNFEIEVANVFKKMGYNTRICKQGGDKGIDIDLFKFDGTREIVQCKAHKNKISPSVARDLYGTMNANNVRKAYLVTLNGATSGTIDFCLKHNIEIWDVVDIIKHQNDN